MESTLAHGIGVRNRFEIFSSEDLEDPLEILRQQEEEKQKRKSEKIQSKEKGKALKSTKPASVVASKKSLDNPASKTKQVPEVADATNKQRKQGDKFPRNVSNSQETKEIEDKKNMRNRDDQYFSSEPKERDFEYRRGRGGYRGRGGRERGRGYFNNAEGRNRRVFDRHSGNDKTGVRPVDKREGAGPNNWGDLRSEINQKKDEANWDEDEFDAAGDKPRESGTWADADTSNDSMKVGKGDEGAVENVDSKENEPVVEEPVEETVKEMTLDEWKREQEAKRVVPKYNLRKPGEGEDDKQWKKAYVLKKKVKDDEEEQDDDDEVDDEDFGRKCHQRQLLDIQINFSDSRRGNRGRPRGGRGGPRSGNRDIPREERGRGMRGGGGNRENAKPKVEQQSAPRVDDWNDFPSLVNA